MKKTSNKFSNIGFILATAGSAVGLGNVICFPFVIFDRVDIKRAMKIGFQNTSL